MSSKTVSVHGSAMYSSFVMNLVALHAGPTFSALPTKSFRIGTDRIEHSACHRSTSASTSTAPPTPPRDTRRERVHFARFAILLECMQTPNDVCPAPAVLPTRLAWRVAVERERQAHGTQNEQMWFLVTQPFLSFDLLGSLPQIPPQTQIHCHTCTQSECASSLRLADEYASASATASAPSASASRLSSSTIDAGSGCVPPRPASPAS